MKIRDCGYITGNRDYGDVCPVFRKDFELNKEVEKAELSITALGVYEAELNGKRVGSFVLAPGWTSYDKRLQVQTYDVKDLIRPSNRLEVVVAKGWFRSPVPGFADTEDRRRRVSQPCGLIALLTIFFADGTTEYITTDETWSTAESRIRFSELYDGEVCDAAFEPVDWQPAKPLAWSKDILIPQEGEEVHETERIPACRIFETPAGETVVDFGQEITGYVELSLTALSGTRIRFTHGEVLDADGNFYNANYRSAKAMVEYTCREGRQTWHPSLTFFGFRYIRLLEYPKGLGIENLTAIAVHSDLRKTGFAECGVPLLNQLFSNIRWGLRDNFLDVPTDCPQRDERLGWTGDAQVFIKAAGYLYDVNRFFRKWLRDLAADQRPSGEVGQVIPDVMNDQPSSAAWGDAAVICPWQLYQTYGDSGVLEDQFDSMKAWVDFITDVTTTPYLWTGHFQFADWLGLDAPSGTYRGSSREDFVASAFYAYSTRLLIQAGHVLGKEMKAYERQYERIVSAFREAFPDYHTQTEHVLAVQFSLAENPKETADALAERIVKDGVQLRTGFVGTPYLLHVLSDCGHADLAWSLLLREEYPSWLYSVRKGATTVWEHWDGIKEDGSFWSTDMNSFNHYAYGSVIDWVFEKGAGIACAEGSPGFERLHFEPHPDRRIGHLTAVYETVHGTVRSHWEVQEDGFRIELETPVEADVVLPSETKTVQPGKYTFRY